MKAAFDVIFLSKEKIILEDLDGPRSITNDAEEVFAHVQRVWPGRRVIYRDTYGEYAEILQDPKTKVIIFADYYTE